MPKINKSRYAILGILSYGPRSGYDIKKMTERSTHHFWAESYGHLYATLKTLEHEGLVTARHQEQRGKPDKKLYTITAAGQTALEQWLHEPTEPAPVRNELLLKLFFGLHAPPSAQQAQIEQFRERQAQRIDTYLELERSLKAEQRDNPNLPYWLMTLSYGRHSAEALLEWSDKSLATLERIANDEEA